MSRKYIAGRPRARIRGEDFYGNIVTIGTGNYYDYGNIGDAVISSPSNTLFLIYPGTYYPNKSIDAARDLYFKGMGLTPNDVKLYVSGPSAYGFYQYGDGNFIFDNLYIQNDTGNNYTIFIIGNAVTTGPRFTIIFNRCSVYCTANTIFYMGQQFGSYIGIKADLLIQHSYLNATIYHFQRVNASPGTNIFLKRVELNKSISTTSFIPAYFEGDVVSTPTVGYGPNYGSEIIEVLDPTLLI